MTAAIDGRIVFPGNPWPEGHALQAFEISGTLHPDEGVKLQLHLKTVAYPEAEDEDPLIDEPSDLDDASGDWESPIVWSNYQACTLSSTHWGANEHSGFFPGARGERFDVAALDNRRYHVDPADHAAVVAEDDALAFGIYLLGHDAVADHRIAFVRADGPVLAFDVRWTGRIALTYSGRSTLDHAFSATIRAAPFTGLRWLGEPTIDACRAGMDRHLGRPDAFLVDPKIFQRRRFVRFLS